MRFVLDASIALCWCFEDEQSRYSEAVLDALKTNTASVPALWPLEVTNGLLMGERRGRLTPQNSVQFMAKLCQLPVQVEGPIDIGSAEKLLSMGRAQKLTAYDALYLSLAMEKGWPLATDDKKLKRACRDVGVDLYRPSLSTT